jgi:hypothetical protein
VYNTQQDALHRDEMLTCDTQAEKIKESVTNYLNILTVIFYDEGNAASGQKQWRTRRQTEASYFKMTYICNSRLTEQEVTRKLLHVTSWKIKEERATAIHGLPSHTHFLYTCRELVRAEVRTGLLVRHVAQAYGTSTLHLQPSFLPILC